MRLYHGTDGARLDVILHQGLRPRGTSRRGNWDNHSIRSNARCVYLTDSYAPCFAINAVRDRKHPVCAVVEVDTDRLDPANLYPDEDFLEQISRDKPDAVPGSMRERTLHFRKQQFKFNWPCINPDDGSPTTWWQASLRYLGTASHRGTIPPAAITRAVRWPHPPNRSLTLVWDAQISLANQQFCGDRYRTLTHKLFSGEFTTPEEARARFEALKDDPIALHNDPILPVIEGWEMIHQKETVA